MVGLTATTPLRDAGLLYVWGDGCITIMVGFILSFGLINNLTWPDYGLYHDAFCHSGVN